MNAKIVEQIYQNNFGSEKFYKRDYYDHLIYTEGIMDFQKQLQAHWFIDNIISYLPQVIQTYQNTEDGFFVVKIFVDKNNSGYIEIYREGYVGDEYNDHITVIKQYLTYIDLPVYDYKFYLILSNYNPLRFTLLLTSEY